MSVKTSIMKCQVCKINEAQPNSIVCSNRCNDIRLKISKLSTKYTPTNGCDNCWGDLGQGCTDTCKYEFKRAREFVDELYSLVHSIINNKSNLKKFKINDGVYYGTTADPIIPFTINKEGNIISNG